MKTRMLLILLAVASATACAAFPAKRTPQLTIPKSAAKVEGSPRIRLEVDDRTEQLEKSRKALERARKKFPFLAGASETTADPDYKIGLTVSYSSTEAGFNDWSYMTMALVPAVFTDEVTVEGKLSDANDRVLGTFESTGRAKYVIQLHLLWAFPLAVPFMPHVENKMWKNSYRDVFIQVGAAIGEDQTQRR